MALFEKHRTVFIAILIALVLAGASVLVYGRVSLPGATEIVISPPSEIVVHVDGAVANPGLYSLKPDSRVANAVDAAGGLASDADRGGVNLAARLRDGDQVYLYRTGEYSQKININTAEPWLLEALPGIGEKLAKSIIDYRTENGAFQTIQDLTRVKGISFALLEEIEGKITVR